MNKNSFLYGLGVGIIITSIIFYCTVTYYNTDSSSISVDEYSEELEDDKELEELPNEKSIENTENSN